MVGGGEMRLLVGDDWAQDHHDIEVMDETGRVLARRRVPEGVAGIGQLHELISRFLPEQDTDAEVQVGIETDRGPWVVALIAAGYTVFPVNPLQASRYRSRHGVSGAKSDSGDAHVLADVVRTDAHQLRPAAGDSQQAEAVKVLARTHKTLIWQRPVHRGLRWAWVKSWDVVFGLTRDPFGYGQALSACRPLV
jgi:transposase